MKMFKILYNFNLLHKKIIFLLQKIHEKLYLRFKKSLENLIRVSRYNEWEMANSN